MTAKINLAPEIYQRSQRNKQLKRWATTLTITICAVAVGVVILMLVILGGQKAGIAVLSGDIKHKQDQIKQMSDLDDAATAQQHLENWQQLNSTKPKVSRFFTVLQTFTPLGISVSSLTIDNGNTITMAGTAKDYALADKLVKALDAANVTIGPNAAASNKPFFTDTKLTSVGQEVSGVTFQLTTQMSGEVTSGQ